MKLLENQFDNADELHYKRTSHNYDSANLILEADPIVESSGEEKADASNSDEEK